MKRNILILANSLQGLYNFREELVETLLNDGYNVYISAPAHQLCDYFTSLGCKCIETKINRHGINPFADLKLVVHYAKLVKRIKPIAVLTYTIKPNLYGGIVCRFSKTPQLVNITGLGSAVETDGLLQSFIVALYRFSLKYARCVFLQNEDNQNFCNARNMIPQRQQLLPGSGVNLDRFQVLPYPPEDKVSFIFIGRIMKQKGIELYLSAAEQIHLKYKNTEFHILGSFEENYSSRITALEERGIVKYHAPVTDITQYLEQVHCTIHPSYYPEGMSNVLLESCASGRAVITTDRSGCREIVDNGVNGFIVKQQSETDLIEKIERFIILPYEEKRAMGLAGRRKMEEQFNRAVVIKAYMEEINSIN